MPPMRGPASVFVCCLLVGWNAAPLGAQGRVSGVVFDSLSRTALVGATVQLVARTGPRGEARAARTDSAGQWAIDAVPRGEYLAGFHHPALDSLGLDLAPVIVRVERDLDGLLLASPAPRSLSAVLCGDAGTVTDTTGMLYGHLRHARTGAPIREGAVTIEWTETRLGGGRVDVVDRADTAITRASGLFVFCHLPGNLPVLARGAQGQDSTGYVEMEVPSGEVRHHTFVVGAANRLAGGDSLAETRWSGDARLTGSIRDVEGRAVPGARVALLGAGVEGLANQAGYFGLDSLPAGTWTLEVRALGRRPQRQVVHLYPGESLPLAIELGDAVTTLATGYIRGAVVYSRKLVEFERRRRTQFTAKFLTPRDLQGRPMTRLSALLMGVQGIEIQRRGSFAMVVMKATSRVPGLDYCAPSLYVDGVLDPTDDYDRWMADDLLGVEVYPREAMRPAEFTNRHRCGSIAIWLRPRPGGG
jgi:Carboxypeptidase regulatory-like domain